MTTTSIRQKNADGSVQFTCSECGNDVFQAVDDGFDFPVCVECRWFGERPWMRERKASVGADSFVRGAPVLYTDHGGGEMRMAVYRRDEQELIGSGVLEVKNTAGKVVLHAIFSEPMARAFFAWHVGGAR